MPTANNIPDFFQWAAQQSGVDPKIAAAVLHQESAGNPTAVSPKGAAGLMQLMPGTAKDLGVANVNDPVDNVDGGLRYLGQQRAKFGTDEKMLAAYNYGPGHVQRGDALPPETQNYIQHILGNQRPAASPSAQPGAPGSQIPQSIIPQEALPDLHPKSNVPDFLEWSAAQQQAPEAPEEKSLGGFLNNVATSGGHFVEGLANTVLHPVDTAKGLGKLALGTTQEVMPNFLKDSLGDQRPTAEAVGRFYKDRISHPIDTAYNDPVGTAADLAALLGIGGALPGKIGELSGAASDLLNPLNAIAKPIQKVSEGVYSSALGTTRTMRKQAGMSAADFARLGLKEGINITDSGAGKANGLAVDAVNTRNDIIDRATQAGQTARPVDVADPLLALKQKMSLDAMPDAKMASVDAARNEFLDKFVTQTGAGPNPFQQMRDVPLNELEKIKETTYRYTPDNAWTSDAVPPALREARQELGSSMRRTIENKTAGFEKPGELPVADLNSRYAQLRALEKAILAQGDAPGGSMRHMLEMLGGVTSGHPLEGFLLPFLDNPAVKSYLAQVGYRAPGAAKAAIAPAALMNALQNKD